VSWTNAFLQQLIPQKQPSYGECCAFHSLLLTKYIFMLNYVFQKRWVTFPCIALYPLILLKWLLSQIYEVKTNTFTNLKELILQQCKSTPRFQSMFYFFKYFYSIENWSCRKRVISLLCITKYSIIVKAESRELSPFYLFTAEQLCYYQKWPRNQL